MNVLLYALAALVVAGIVVVSVHLGGHGIGHVTRVTSAHGSGPVPLNTVLPVVSGSLNVGSTMTVTNGTWSNSPTSFSYQWNEGGNPVGTNANTYVSTTVGASIYCTVGGINAAGIGFATSASVGPVTGAGLATPTLAIQSALGAAPLTLEWSDTDYIVGDYGQLQIDQTSNAFGAITQNIVFLVDGASWASLDESIGLVTPSGTYWARIRALRDNDSGTTTISGAKDQTGSTIPDFNADVSSWSNTVTDTISASSAALTSTAGTSASKLLAFSGTPTLSWNIPSGNGGAVELSRATIAAQHTDTYCELTVGTLAGNNIIGMTDTSIDFNGGGAGFFGGGSAYPGDATLNGFSIFVDGSSGFVGWHANGSSGAFSAGGSGNTAAGDTIGVEYNSSTHVATIFYKRGAAAMAQIGTLTLTSLIPATPFAFTGGKSNLDAATINFGASTFVLGSTGPNGSPSGSNIYG